MFRRLKLLAKFLAILSPVFCLSNHLSHGEMADEFETDLSAALDSVLVVVEPHEIYLSAEDENRRLFDWALIEECFINNIEAVIVV